jgi:hypothetical protein
MGKKVLLGHSPAVRSSNGQKVLRQRQSGEAASAPHQVHLVKALLFESFNFSEAVFRKSSDCLVDARIRLTRTDF